MKEKFNEKEKLQLVASKTFKVSFTRYIRGGS